MTAQSEPINANATYHADTSCISNSMLSVLKKSPKEFYGRFIAKTIEPEQSKDFLLGEVVHCLVFEPSEFLNRFALELKCDRRTTAGKDAWRQFCEQLEGKTVLEESVATLASKMAAELVSHYEAAKLLRVNNQIVESRIDFEWSGVRCKCKPDLVLPDLGLIVDVKTTKDASPEAFAKSISTYGYARQHAFYREACKQKYGKQFRFLFLVVSKKQPFETACYELTNDGVEVGELEIEALVSDYSKRMRTNNWEPSWSSGIVQLDLPRWYKANVFVDETEEEEEESE